MKKPHLLLAVLLSCLFSTHQARALVVSIADDSLTLHADQTPLQTILQRFVEQGIAVHIAPDINPPISAAFNRRKIQEALTTILGPLNFALNWQASGSDRDGKRFNLKEIQIFRAGEKGRMRLLVRQPSGNLEVVQNPVDGTLYVKNELLLTLAGDLTAEALREILAPYGAIIAEALELTGVYRIVFPDGVDVLAILAELRSRPGIAGGEPNFAYPAFQPFRGTTPLPPADPGRTGNGPANTSAPVAILDSGLAVGSELEKYALASFDAMRPGQDISDQLGHGTQMAYIISGVTAPYGTPAADTDLQAIIPIRAFDDNGFTSSANIMDSIRYALNNGAKVMNLSWGSETDSTFMAAAFADARAKGMVIIAAAGNQPTGKPTYPCAFEGIICVGALDPHGKTWDQSNYGDFVDLYAAGFAKMAVGYKGEPGLYAGTSISSALVARDSAAYLAANPGASAQNVYDYLKGKY